LIPVTLSYGSPLRVSPLGWNFLFLIPPFPRSTSVYRCPLLIGFPLFRPLPPDLQNFSPPFLCLDGAFGICLSFLIQVLFEPSFFFPGREERELPSSCWGTPESFIRKSSFFPPPPPRPPPTFSLFTTSIRFAKSLTKFLTCLQRHFFFHPFPFDDPLKGELGLFFLFSTYISLPPRRLGGGMWCSPFSLAQSPPFFF